MVQPTHRLLLPLATLACLAAPLSACKQDEPALVTPRVGTWSYVETEIVSNSCDATLTPDTNLESFFLSKVEGDTFQVKYIPEDLSCEIDGYDFYCSRHLINSEANDEFDYTTSLHVIYEGTFASETEVEGVEILELSCAGEDCNVIESLVPCSVETAFEGNFVN